MFVKIYKMNMTKDIKEEMAKYKLLAIDIEKKLATLHAAKQYHTEIMKRRYSDSQYKNKVCNSQDNLIPSECKDVRSNETNVTTIGDISPETSESSNENIDKISQSSKKISTDYKSEYQINQASNAASRPGSITTSIDADPCLNETNSTKSDTTEIMSEIWKPQVPKTLDIVPLTLNNPSCEKDGKYQENGLNTVENTPKLVRQGSYVLDTPSPILLAHMQMEMASSTCTSCSEYVPTPSTNTARRKEWNIAQAKIEWEDESKRKEFISAESLGLFSKHKGTSHSNTNRKIRKSVSVQAKPEPTYETYPSTRSVDCIQTMLANEYTSKNNVQINHNRGFAMDSHSEKKQRNQKWKKCNSFSTFHSTHKRGCSLENLSSVNVPPSKSIEQDQISANNNFAKQISRYTETEDSVPKLKSSIASDKLLTVYRRVQEMHKQQMAELLFRQQREQTLLQKEFEKQQLLLLTEIKMSFPELSAPLLSENILSTTFSPVTPNNEQPLEHVDHSVKNIKNLSNNSQEENKDDHLQDNNTRIISCPLDYIYPATEPLPKIDDTLEEKKEAEVQLDNIGSHEKELIEENCRSKRLSVSRQLFPLDSKTTHVPIPEKALYSAKHIKAVNVINAYVRGYLVRRMMQTERVIALKNTYKEALHCMLKLHVDAPLNRSEFNFLHRLQLQCDAASMNIVELFAQSPKKRMQVIAQDREIKQSRIERPTSARSYSFATQRTLARKKLKEMEEYQPSSFARSCSSRSRCQTWTSDVKEKLISPNVLYNSIKRSTSAGAVRKPWR
ncbi:uncharacterized protein LOC143188509 isoform X2 [Calliopsis andreniformis]|uniref:uncharacterized protein LOC143188509 isoform X2 n=1 Tax=Calliopsis andreniformis TaxID=337506 RepID=UPI003FCC8A38